MSTQLNLKKLKKDYEDNSIVIFIGSGLSAPYGIPTWKRMIMSIAEEVAQGDLEFIKKAVENDLEKNNYWGAVEALKNYATLGDEDIQQYVCQMISRINADSNKCDNNYKDLKKLKCSTFLTTNYDNLLYQNLQTSLMPVALRDIDFNIQDLFKERRIINLHGNISNAGTIVLSSESYRELYDDLRYRQLMGLISGSKKMLFLGFSFDDYFMSKLLKSAREYFNGQHYIVLNNPDPSKVTMLKTEYGLNTIHYDHSNSNHVEEIRKILNFLLREESGDDDAMDKPKTEDITLIGANISDLNEDKSDSIFYKKILLENIDTSLANLSKSFFIASEVYIRELRASGMSIDVINAVFGKIFIAYQEIFSEIYVKYGDSEELLISMHRTLESIDFGRLKKFFSTNQMMDNEEIKGMIHILSDDCSKDIWWGEKRFE
ncbi:ABC-three component system protein [Listeria booriae]|uniref:SIR2 family protein n=2 Tax=Listeria booriae TaxID=1552123 RepID=A0A7X1DJ30_9LIST|nr:ABC-three component system protein [Listeria booriae]MBC1335309.1 SIR2 family protein [Listeria booriae]MBC2294018.1 SIR2 family protein [Listeria booriae]MBC2309551.1 SIR2 family protein [Listeria booriae]